MVFVIYICRHIIYNNTCICNLFFSIWKKLKGELEKLKKYENDEDVAFLKFVYVTWPPKRKDFKMDEPSSIKGVWSKEESIASKGTNVDHIAVCNSSPTVG